ncbi:GGDEF domain-containing protein [Arcobacter vandammei]|uniref:GGDEF domain-containing protein n=1 Tax=Arcobacter vandammei TaxID=2782243 RepID=UPI0018E05104|nr:GGDEF domain-containing protein [Arcobacter vandammei]
MNLLTRMNQKFGIGLILIVIISVHIFIIFANSFVIKYAIYSIEDDATLLNRSGMIRGGVQRIVKLELDNQDTAKDREIIDNIFNEFLVEDKYKLVGSSMFSFIIKLELLKIEWDNLKNIIDKYEVTKSEENKKSLIKQSEVFWKYSEDTLFILSEISTKKTYILNTTFFIFIVDFFLLIFVIFLINAKIRRKLEILSRIDPLTKTFNRNVFNETMDYEIELNKRYENNLGFILLDIDLFKIINDTFGHDKGDFVLKNLASLLKNSIRKNDKLFRVGGEEFVIVAKNIKNMNELENFANKLRVEVENFDFGLKQKVTISLGATTLVPNDEKENVFKRADEALYKSKENGRNRVTIF